MKKINFICQVNEIDETQWNFLIGISQTRSFFQTRDCYDFYAANSGLMDPFCFAVVEDGQLKGVIIGFIQRDGKLIKRFLSRRAIINSGPLLADDISDEALCLLLTETKRHLQGKSIYIECRNYEDYSRYKEVFGRCQFEYVPHLNFHIDTTSEDLVNSNLGKSRKRDIRVSLRDGAEIIEGPSIDEVRDFYVILDNLYKTKVKTPLYPLSFFEHLYRQDYSKFILVKFNGRIVGGTVCVCLPNHAVYEWFACGEDGIHKNIHPSTVATYAGIRFAAQNNFKHFDMMGAGKPDDDYGVRDFKAKFGGQLIEHGRFIHIQDSLLYNIGCLGVKLMKKLG